MARGPKGASSQVQQINDFMELWVKFHELYQAAMGKERIAPEEERGFLETKSLLARKYQALIDTLGIAPSAEDRTFDVISQILTLRSVSSLSDMQLNKIEADWHNSYISLNKMLGSIESRQAPASAGGEGGASKQNPAVVAILVIIVLGGIAFLLWKLGIAAKFFS